MDVSATQWTASGGWQKPLPPWDGASTLVVAFGGSELTADRAPDRSDRRLPELTHRGLLDRGEIWDDTVSDGTLTVSVTRFATTAVTLVCEPVIDVGCSYDVGRTVGTRLVERAPGLSAVFVLSDGLVVNGSALVTGLLDGTGGRVTITGGLAGDGDRFNRSWVLVDGEPRIGYVTAVGLTGGDLGVGHGSQGGYDIFGPERLITRSSGNVLLELDGQPALGLYKRYLGERAAGLPATALLFPLAVRVSGGPRERVVRTILAVDESAQSMTFAGDVPEGATVQLMRANFDRLIDGAQDAMTLAVADAVGPTLTIAISCVGRRLVLGQRCEDELEAARSVAPQHGELVGFYSYGEISPLAPGTCDLHNQTMTVTTLWERP